MFCAVCTAVALASSVHSAAEASPYNRAVLARQAGDPNEAARLLEQWLGDRPDDVDGRLQYGYALLDLERLGEAEIAFRRVLRQAPAYADARIGLARISQRRGELSRARAWLSSVPHGNADAQALRTQLAAAAGNRWRLEAGAGVTALGRNQPDWREVAGQLQFQPSAQTWFSGRVEATSRFGLSDVYGEAQIAHRFSPALSAYLVAGLTPGADYRPRRQLGVGFSARLRPGANSTVLTFDTRYASYRSGEIVTMQPGIEQYVWHGKAWITGRLITLTEGAETHVGALGRMDVQATPALRLFAGAARAPDTSEGVVAQVDSLFGGVEVALDSRHSLRLSLARAHRNAGADRLEFAAGLAARF